MKDWRRVSVLGLVISFFHLAFSLWLYLKKYGEGWDYFPIALIDFPVTLLLAAIQPFIELNSWWGPYFVLGSIWCYIATFYLEKFHKSLKSDSNNK